MPLGRCGVETVQGVGSLPILRAIVRAWLRQRRNAFFRSAAGRIIRHTQRLTSCQQLQPSSAVVSAAVVGTGLLRDRGRPLHAAFVLTEFKTKERRVSHDRAPNSEDCLCPRGSGVPHGKGQGRISPEIRWKRPHLPMGGLRPLRRSMIDKEIYIWQRKSSTGGPMEPW